MNREVSIDKTISPKAITKKMYLGAVIDIMAPAITPDTELKDVPIVSIKP